MLFLGRILEFIRTFPKGESGDRTALDHPLSLTLIAFVCTAIPAFLLTKVIGKHLESLRLMATSLLVGGIIMWVVDAWSVRRQSTTEDVEHMTLGQSIWIGLCQVTSAVFPGTSRSMSTIAAGQIVNMTPLCRARVQLPRLHPDDGGRHRLRSAAHTAPASTRMSPSRSRRW